MSASLVGSEMCIRDSNSISNNARRRVKTRPAQTGPAQTCSQAKKLNTCCLLYTSDAADDM
eukprot:5663324-Alexandrium_andersonii.AAC.1